jgi:hypothetical protein
MGRGATHNMETPQHHVSMHCGDKRAMKTETKNKYFERLSGLRRQCQEWMMLSEWEDRASKLWERVRAVENEMIDGVNLNTLSVSNAIQSLENSADVLRRNIAGEIDIPAEGAPIEPMAAKPISQLGETVMEVLGNIQEEYNDLYAAIIEKHPLIAELPVVLELKMRAAEAGATMQKFGRLLGNL